METLSKLTIVGLVIAALIWGKLAGAAAPVNLLPNGDFEAELTGWILDSQHSVTTEKGAARSGKACLAAEVTMPNKALTLSRRVHVQAKNLYKFEIWARATNRTKLVLWVQQPGSTKRELVTAWKDVPSKWRRFNASLNVKSDGVLELQIVSPSSYGVPPGRIWIDDLAFYEIAMPLLTPVSKGAGFNDEPAMAKAGDGTMYVAWNSFRDGADSLQLARFKQQGAAFKELGASQILGGKGTYILAVCAVPAGQNAIVLYAAERKGNWDVFAVTCGPGGVGEPLAVTSNPGGDMKPHAATAQIIWT